MSNTRTGIERPARRPVPVKHPLPARNGRVTSIATRAAVTVAASAASEGKEEVPQKPFVPTEVSRHKSEVDMGRAMKYLAALCDRTPGEIPTERAVNADSRCAWANRYSNWCGSLRAAIAIARGG